MKAAPILVCGECHQRPEVCPCPEGVRRHKPLVDLRKVVRDIEKGRSW